VTVVIAGGGTGGHLYPGLAVAREILRRDPAARVSFAGTARGLEARIVPREGFELDLIRSAGLKGKSLTARARGVGLLAPAFLDAWRIVSRRRPQVVVGVGGYSSGPVVMAAVLRGVPTLVLEQNAAPGLTNRVLARWVRAAAVSYESTLGFFHGRGFVAGNPVRPEFFARPPARGSADAAEAPSGLATAAPGATRVLVFGGSQGAHAINAAMAAAAPALAARGSALSLTHQTGERDLAMVEQAYRQAGLTADVRAFIDPMAPAMLAADLVVCRAGATTLAELAAAGRPAILVPFPGATDDHQRKNAEVVQAAGGADLIDQRDLTGERIAAALASLSGDRARLRAMSDAMRRLAAPDAASRIVDRIEALAKEARA
jgi:UDP-N-acetylglucosamine--N-acetylmuramyl-(pentapeptide) pyrophosphoryl-undecaprenol N-acetylglucosamine transferase